MNKVSLGCLNRLFAAPWAIREEELLLMPQMLGGHSTSNVQRPTFNVQGQGSRCAANAVEPQMAQICADGLQPCAGTSWKVAYWDFEKDAVVRDFYPTQKGYEVFNYEGLIASLRGTLPDLPEGVTVLLLWGVLGRGWGDADRYWLDAVDLDEVQQVLRRVPEGNRVVLWFRSPGGVVTGTPECGAFVREFSAAGARAGKQVVAFTDDLCASAAYWLASQCGEIVGTPTASVGSIGVYVAFYDYVGMLEKAGVALHLWKAGEEKGDGLLGNPVSKKMEKRMQGLVLRSYELFTAAVTEMRAIDSSTMQGQCFEGEEAVAVNLVDRLVPGAAEFFESLS